MRISLTCPLPALITSAYKTPTRTSIYEEGIIPVLGGIRHIIIHTHHPCAKYYIQTAAHFLSLSSSIWEFSRIFCHYCSSESSAQFDWACDQWISCPLGSSKDLLVWQGR